jgi:ParB/RepB/Spo0J family partition protein
MNHMNARVSSPSSAISPGLTIRNLALANIDPSTTAVQARRRTRYDAAALKELAENIKAVQVIEPIIVRPTSAGKQPERFEIIAGERRWRASREAGLDTIPAIIRVLDDGQVLEIQLVENLHREGLHELEEAEGYETLMQQHHYDIEQLCAKFGRSRAYVYTRLKLLALDKKSREAFYAGKLTASTALLLARIPVLALQHEALKAITATWNGQPLAFKDAQRHIQDHYMTRLKDAPFDAKAGDLVPGIGPCSSCPKLTGNQPELFGDIKSADVCTDPVCFAAKRAAWGERLQAQAKAEGRTVLTGKDAKRIAPYGVNSNLQGGYVSLDQPCYEDEKRRTYRQLLGKEFTSDTVIADPETGRVVEVIKPSDHLEALKAKGLRAERATRGDDSERVRQQAARAETVFRERVFAAVRAKTPASIAAYDLRLLAQALWQTAGHDARVRLVKLWDWAGKSHASDEVHRCDTKILKLEEQELRRFVLDCALISEVRANPYDTRKPVKLLETAKRLRINTDDVRKSLKAEQAAKKGLRSKGTTVAVSDQDKSAKRTTV